MRPVRVIHLDHLKYKYINIVQTEKTMAVRVLCPIPTSDNRELIDPELILTDRPIVWNIIGLDNKLFQIVGEAIFDLDNPVHKAWFKSNANICFVVNAAFPRGEIAIVPQHLVAPNTFEHTPDWAKREGIEVIAQLYCWSDNDCINNTPCSFAVDNKGIVYTNIDPQRMQHVDSEWMKRDDRSAFVTLQHQLSVETEQNNAVQFTLQCSNLGNVVDCSGTYLVESTSGYIPVREIHVEHGVGTFCWYPIFLKENDPVNITVRDIQGKPCCSCSMRVKS